jgi:hypothetical protein
LRAFVSGGNEYSVRRIRGKESQAMSSLIVLCPHCLTWIEIHAQCCTECGTSVTIEDPDPDNDTLTQRLGERLSDAGPVKLIRRGWPNFGRLLATTEGLLFIPQFSVQPNGALEAVTTEAPRASQRVANLFHWWSLPLWRRPVDQSPVRPEAAPLPSASAVDLLFDSPGALFIQRTSIKRIVVRWGRVQIERPPSRSVSLVQVSSGSPPRDALRQLIEFPPWHGIVAGL